MSDPSARRAGVLVPLFSCASSASWGIGDVGDLPAVAAWLAAAGQRILQLLPVNEMAPGQQSPYSAISAMAIDPIFIRVTDVPEFAALGSEASLSASEKDLLAAVRRSSRIDYTGVRNLKYAALEAAFARFFTEEWDLDTSRARSLKAFVSAQAWWIEDYALFRAIHASEHERPWTEWPRALQRREPVEIDRARRDLSAKILFYQYLQWTVSEQWRAARAGMHGVALFGDLPFMVDGDSADVWARPEQFLLDASVGAPPDAFSDTGQDWGMPVYRWDVMAAGDFRWLRERARRNADLYDGYRIDHLVGFYRTYARPRDGSEPFFTPADESSQTVLGEQVLAVFRGPGATIIAEDLGTVPDFVRASLARLGIPGFQVFRWERYWHMEGQPFRDPADYPAVSVAASGTHDTEAMAAWWTAAPREERQKVAELGTIERLAGGIDIVDAPYNPAVRDVLLEALFASGSNILLLPLPDVFGWTDRINEPATVGGVNWTYRLPWWTDQLNHSSEAIERRATLARWASGHGR
jgi:4-alpha-glucanotransferase